MRMKSILLAALALFIGALTSCKKSSCELDENEAAGNTYAAITLSFGDDAFRASEEDDFNKRDDQWEGNDAIKTVDIYLVAGDVVSSGQYTLSDFNIEQTSGQETKLLPKKAIKTTAGSKNVYVLVNAPDAIRQTLAVTTKTAFETAWKTVYVAYTAKANTEAYKIDAPAGMKKLATLNDTDKKDIIMMSNEKLFTMSVEEGVTYEDAMKSPNPKNRAVVPVKRVAARVVLTTKATSYDVKNIGTGEVIGKITDITYAVAQGEKKMNIQQVIDNNIIKTPAYDVLTTDGYNNSGTWTKMDDNYDYSDLFIKDRSVTQADFSTLNAKKIAEIEKRPAFIIEANHKRHVNGNTPATYDGGFFRGNTPYVLVRTKFKPTQAALAENNLLSELPADGTFYLGTTTGKIYTSAANVKNPAKGGLAGQKYRKYEKGKVLYYAYVNPDNKDRRKVLDAPAFRNNVYHVHINDIKALGFNWNPLYPEDPKKPDPINPDPKPKDDDEDPEPPVKPEDPLGDKDIYMSVEVKVLKWNVHSYEVDLGL